ncbi:MAG TPA: DUF4893 domain-containing protein [Kofleriaceae bacterium]|jgi:hypothetical protein|nr:DUF4893 domain-containing protein [Kofleriaceae bacterium]
MSRFGLVLLFVAACGHASEKQELSNRAQGPANAALPAGDYACRLDEGGYLYPPFRCVVEARGGRTWFEKVEGSVRFRGWLSREGDAFAFDGEVYCPWGDCTEKAHAVFAMDRSGAYRGTIKSMKSGPITVLLSYVPGGGGAGGQGYGGESYGYGGSTYSGTIIDW